MLIESLKCARRRLLPLVVLLVLPGCEVVTDPGANSPAISVERAAQGVWGRLHFVHGYEAGLQEALGENRPLLVFFTAQWCRYCHEMADEAFTDPQVVQLAERFVCVVVDADSESWVCQDLDVKAFPTIQFFSPQGMPLKRLVGKKEIPQLVCEMRSTLQAVALRAKTSQAIRR